jgi:hypothetical protein
VGEESTVAQRLQKSITALLDHFLHHGHVLSAARGVGAQEQTCLHDRQ